MTTELSRPNHLVQRQSTPPYHSHYSPQLRERISPLASHFFWCQKPIKTSVAALQCKVLPRATQMLNPASSSHMR